MCEVNQNVYSNLMLDLSLFNPILVHIFTNQILMISIMGKYSKEFRSMKNGSNSILKSFLIVLFMISIVHMSESNVEDVTESTGLVETDNLQAEEKTEEPLRVMNQVAYFQELNSNSLLSFIPDLHASANDEDDNEQNDAQESSYLVAETGSKSGSKGLVRTLKNEDSMVKLLKGNRMLTSPLESNDENNFLKEQTRNGKMYLVDRTSEIERIRGYLPTLMKLKRLVKKCQCSYRDEDQYSSIKDPIMPTAHTDHRVNLDYVDSDDESDEEDKDDDEDAQYALRQKGFNFNKYKKFDINNFRDEDEMEAENEDFETVNRFNELKDEEDRNIEENNLDEFEGTIEDDGGNEDEDDSSVDDDEFDEPDENKDDDPLNNSNNLSNNNNSEQNEKLLSPFMTNLSPTSSSDLIFNSPFNNELSMNANTLDEPTENESNEIQLAKLKRILADEALNNNESDLMNQQVADEVTNPLEASASSLSTQYAASILGSGGLSSGRGSSHRGGGGHGGNKRNIFDHWILIRKKRQSNKSSKSHLESKKGGNSGGGRTNRNR